jgi:hypothetical protein
MLEIDHSITWVQTNKSRSYAVYCTREIPNALSSFGLPYRPLIQVNAHLSITPKVTAILKYKSLQFPHVSRFSYLRILNVIKQSPKELGRLYESRKLFELNNSS